MRCSSGSVSWPTSMMGGWYVCIMDMGRDERPVSARWRCGWAGDGEARSLLKSFSAVALSANEWAVGGGFEGDCGAVGDAGPGEGAADEVFVLDWCGLPPHCDMNERTVHERTERSISECSLRSAGFPLRPLPQRSTAEGRPAQICSYLPLLGRAMVDALSSGSPEAPPSYEAPRTPGSAGSAFSASLLLLGQPRTPRMRRLQVRARKGCAGANCVQQLGGDYCYGRGGNE